MSMRAAVADFEIPFLRHGLAAALDLIRDRDRRIRNLEHMNLHLSAQLRSAVSGRTLAAERQQIERERLDAAVDARFAHRHRREVA
jgi:hypothetical protein